jgi:4-hydroxy-tetrahydrodipicolinate synthase
MLYLRNDGIGLDTIEKLCAIEGVAGVKWASPTPLRLAEAIRRCVPTSFGSAASPNPGRRRSARSARAASPPASSTSGRPIRSRSTPRWRPGDYPRANRLIGVMSRFEEIRAEEQNGTNVTTVKAALQLMGDDCGPTRPPSAWPLTEKQATNLRALLADWNLLAPPETLRRAAAE